MPKVFLITGTSTGFGRALVQHIISSGDIAIATARKVSSISPSSFQDARPNENFLALPLDVVSSQSTLDSIFDQALQVFQRIDVVINNAGYALAGPFESLSEQQIRDEFEVNTYGTIKVTRAALRVMRTINRPSGGLIMQISSIAGQVAMPMGSIYSASKFAVEGFTEGVHLEMKPEWNIRFMLIEPGVFRTDGLGRSAAFPDTDHEAYAHLNARAAFSSLDGLQPGDAGKGARAMYELALMSEESAPFRVVLGRDASEQVDGKIRQYQKEFGREDMRKLGTSLDIDQ